MFVKNIKALLVVVNQSFEASQLLSAPWMWQSVCFLLLTLIMGYRKFFFRNLDFFFPFLGFLSSPGT